MAEELLETVERLQSRLSENQEPRKLMKTLKRLGELPMTVDILVETGVGKAVNAYRKHDAAGEIAKGLVAKWKKLVPQSADRPSNSDAAKEAPRSHAQHPLVPERDGGAGRKRLREPSPEVEPLYEEEEEKQREEEEEERMEERGYSTNYSPSPPRHQHHSPPPPAQRGGYQSEGYESPEPEPSPPPPPPRKEVRHAKPHKEPGRNHHHSSHGDRDREEERRRRHAQTSSDRGGEEEEEEEEEEEGGEEEEETGGGGNSEGKKRSAEREQDSGHRASKHSRHAAPSETKKEKDREKKGGSDGRPRVPKDTPAEEEEGFDAPTQSFESFLTYDAPTPVKKKKKPSSSSHGRPSHPSSSSSSSSSHHTRAPQPASTPAASSSSSSSSKASKANGTKSNSSSSRRRSEAGSTPAAVVPTPEKRRKAVVDVALTLPDIPLPAIQPNYRPLPSLDITPLSPQRRKVPVSTNEEEDSGFTGRRFNSKMSVYSGAKTAYLPKMMTLYEQCIRVLQNNIDSIDEVGGVPFEILEPVLERCTPEQLYRIEQCNQCFMEDSDELWKSHCQRDFRRASPQEYESWREMYLRLHDEREERLRMLTQNISSAHANKPKGRQVKMAFVNSVAKPPRDVRRRQEKFGTTTTSTASSTAAAAPIKIRPAVSYSSHSTEPSRSSYDDASSAPSSSPPQSSSRASGGGGGGGGGGHAARDKPMVKKIAPMMAKTIKAFKNRFSRR